MLELPIKFKQALGNGVRTSLYPLVRIYKGVQIDDDLDSATEVINLSIKETNISGEAYNPLLLSSPSISSKADIINNKYTISSVSLSISNAPYNGKIFSDDIPSLLNSVVQVYYAANGLDTLEDCLLVYTGTIRRYSQSAESLNLTLEDLTEQKLKTKIPATLIEDDGYHKEEDFGKPYPMVYGTVDKSPLIYNLENKLEIDKPNREIKNYWSGEGIMNYGNEYFTENHKLIEAGYLKLNAYLSIYEGGFVPIYQQGTRSWGSRVHENLQNAHLYTLTNATTESPANIKLNTDTFIYEGKQDDGQGGFINIGKQGIPSRIYRPISKVSFAGVNDFDENPESENRFIGFNESGEYPLVAAEEMNTTGNNRGDEFGAQAKYDEFWDDGPTDGDVLKYWQPTQLNDAYIEGNEDEIFDYVDRRWETFYNSYSSAYFPVSWIQNSDNTTGLHISAQNRGVSDPTAPKFGCFARLQIEDNVGSLPCVTKIFYDIDYFVIGNLFVGGGTRQSEPVKFWVERELVNQLAANEYFGTAQEFLNYAYLWEEFRDDDEWVTHGVVPNNLHNFKMELNAEESGFDDLGYVTWGWIKNDGGLTNNDGYTNIIKNFDTTNATNTINWGMPRYGSSQVMHSCIANLKEIYILQDSLILDYNNRKFYTDIAGRMKDNELILSANGIMKDILQDELLYEGNVNEDEVGIQNQWQYSFSTSEQKEAKQIFEGMFKSSLLIPSFDSAGQFKFIGIKQLIDSDSDVGFINTEDVIKYSFQLTKLDDVYNSVNVRYKKNYGSGEYDKQTGYEIGDTIHTTLDDYTTTELGYGGNNAYDINYYGLDSEDTKLEVETEYIRDKYTAARLQKRLLLWHCNQHLITKVDLPAHYMHLEAGDYIKYSDLLGGKLAFGYDYTISERSNGQLIYPAFFITKVSKSLSKVSVEAVQVHRGEYGFPSNAEEDEGDIINGDGDDVTDNNQLPDPQDDPNYNEDSIGTEEWDSIVDPFLRLQMIGSGNLNDGPVNGLVSTNMDETWEYNIWVRAVSQDIDIDGDGEPDYFAGDYEVGDESGMDLVNHAVSMTGDNNGIITIEKNFEFYESAFIEFTLEVKNTADYQDEGYFRQYGTPPLVFNNLYGDINQDDLLNILDVVTIVNAITAGATDELPDDGDGRNIADINDDGEVNVLDIVILVNEILYGEID